MAGRDQRVVKDTRVQKRFRRTRRELPNGHVSEYSAKDFQYTYSPRRSLRSNQKHVRVLIPQHDEDFGSAYCRPLVDLQPVSYG